MSLDKLRIDPTQGYLDVQQNELVFVESRKLRSGQERNVAWPSASIERVANFLDNQKLDEYLQTVDEALPIEKLIIELADEGEHPCRHLFMKHLVEKWIPLNDLLNQVPEAQHRQVIANVYKILVLCGGDKEVSETIKNIGITERKSLFTTQFQNLCSLLDGVKSEDIEEIIQVFGSSSIIRKFGDSSLDVENMFTSISIVKGRPYHNLILIGFWERFGEDPEFFKKMLQDFRTLYQNNSLPVDNLDEVEHLAVLLEMKEIVEVKVPDVLFTPEFLKLCASGPLKGRIDFVNTFKLLSSLYPQKDPKEIVRMCGKEYEGNSFIKQIQEVSGKSTKEIDTIRDALDELPENKRVRALLKIIPTFYAIDKVLNLSLQYHNKDALLRSVLPVIDRIPEKEIPCYVAFLANFRKEEWEELKGEIPSLLPGIGHQVTSEMSFYVIRNIVLVIQGRTTPDNRKAYLKEHAKEISEWLRAAPLMTHLAFTDVKVMDEILQIPNLSRLKRQDERNYLRLARVLRHYPKANVEKVLDLLNDGEAGKKYMARYLHGIWDGVDDLEEKIRLFYMVVDGSETVREKLMGKPTPETLELLHRIIESESNEERELWVTIPRDKLSLIVVMFNTRGNLYLVERVHRLRFFCRFEPLYRKLLEGNFFDQMSALEQDLIMRTIDNMPENVQALAIEKLVAHFEVIAPLYNGASPHDKQKIIEHLLSLYDKDFEKLPFAAKLYKEGEPYYNLLCVESVIDLPLESLGTLIDETLKMDKQLPVGYLPLFLTLMAALPEDKREDLSQLMPNRSSAPLIIDDTQKIRGCIQAIRSYVNVDALRLCMYLLDLTKMVKIPSLKTVDLIDLPYRMQVLTEIQPVLPHIPDQQAFFVALTPMLNGAKQEEVKNIVEIALYNVGGKVSKDTLVAYMTKRYPESGREHAEILSKLSYGVPPEVPWDALLRTVDKDEGHILEAIYLVVNGLNPKSKEHFLITLIKDVKNAPIQVLYEAANYLYPLCPLHFTTLIQALSDLPPENRLPVLQHLKLFQNLFLPNDIENEAKKMVLIKNNINLFNSALPYLQTLKDKQYARSLDLYVIIHSLIKISPEQFNATLQANQKVPDTKKWVYWALVAGGVPLDRVLPIINQLDLYEGSVPLKLDVNAALIQIFSCTGKDEAFKVEVAKLAISVIDGTFSSSLNGFVDLLLSHYDDVVALQIDKSRALRVLRKVTSKEEIIEELFKIQLEVIKLPKLTQAVELPTSFEYLPPKITIVPQRHDYNKVLEAKIVCHAMGVESFPQLALFKKQLQMEPVDYFELLYESVPFSELPVITYNTLPPQSPDPKPDLSKVPSMVPKYKPNMERLIMAAMGKKDIHWDSFGPETFSDIERFLEWIFFEPDPDTLEEVFKAFDESVKSHCPADWRNEAEFQYTLRYGNPIASGADYIQSFAAKIRFHLLNGVIQLLAKRDPDPSTYSNRFNYFSDNHVRNRILLWLKSRLVPGSESMDKKIDPSMPDTLQYNIQEEDVVAAFDSLLNTRVYVEGLEEIINDPTFNKQDLLREWLRKNPLAASYEVSEFTKPTPKEPKLQSTLDLTPLFEYETSRPLRESREVVNLRQTLKRYEKEVAPHLSAWEAAPGDKNRQQQLQFAIRIAQERDDRWKGNTLQNLFPECTFDPKDLEDYFHHRITFDRLYKKGLAGGQQEAFAFSLMDPNDYKAKRGKKEIIYQKFKPEALFLMLLQSGLYKLRQ